VGFTVDGPKYIGSERQKEPWDPTQKLRLPIIKSISWSRLAKIGIMVGGCGQKLMVPKQIWLPSIIELLLGVGKKVVEFLIPTPKIPMVGAN
jgi:hypothetical protein